MSVSEFAKEYYKKMFPEKKNEFIETDPEFVERFKNFAFDEVINQNNLDDRTRFIAIMASILGVQGVDEFKFMLTPALNFGVKPEELKEIVYQAVAYLGIGRVYPFLRSINDVFQERGINLPLENGATTTMENRLEKGIQAQVDIIGKEMENFYKSGPEETKHINYYLAENCFGDYYTRKWLDYKDREMITFCFLSALGGCEPQLISHAKANMKVGNDKQFLINVVTECLPYIGYPRSLNAIRCINEAEKMEE